MWDLEKPAYLSAGSDDLDDDDDDDNDILAHPPSASAFRTLYQPDAYAPKAQTQHTHGITHASFMNTDSAFLLTSSYDHTLKAIDSLSLTPTHSYNLGSSIYHHALSPLASHFVVAAALHHPAVRLVDLRTRSAVQALAGHAAAAVLALAWSPVAAHTLASAGADGTVRLWDIRRSAACLGLLDQDDHVGLGGTDERGNGARPRDRGTAHRGAANAVVWTPDGRYLVTAGHDARIRVWESWGGRNTLVSFGPRVRNGRVGRVGMVVAGEVLLWPNEGEVLVFEVMEGTLVGRLRAGGKGGIRALAWRAGEVEVLSAHGDGAVRSWRTRTRGDAAAEEDEEDENEAGRQGRKRKREVLEAVGRAEVRFT